MSLRSFKLVSACMFTFPLKSVAWGKNGAANRTKWELQWVLQWLAKQILNDSAHFAALAIGVNG